jgi:uncharacterized RDD family membrane protein YckC
MDNRYLSSDSDQASQNDASWGLATPGRRLAGLLLDGALAVVTFFVGWLLWSLFTFRKGQTPGMRLLRLRVYDQTTGNPASWIKMFVRQFGVNLLISLILEFVGGIINVAIGYHIPAPSTTLPTHLTLANSGLFSTGAILVLQIIWFFADALWIFAAGQRHRLVDLICKTDVVDESKTISA